MSNQIYKAQALEIAKMAKSISALESENEKLREYAKMYLAAINESCDFCQYCDPFLCDTETDPMREGCRLWKEMCELEIEVDK